LAGPAVIVHTQAHVDAALAAAAKADREITLLTPPGGARYGGPAYFLELIRAGEARHPGSRATAVLDCGGDAALAQLALAAGWRRLVLSGPARSRDKVRDIGGKYGRSEILARPPKALDLALAADPVGALRDLLARP
jgi:hypothetical protein